jgi:hypothetical protein
MINMLGGNRRSSQQRTQGDADAPDDLGPAPAPADLLLTEDEKEGPEDRAQHGPFDTSETADTHPYVDLGALKIPPRDNLVLKVQVQQEAQRIMAVSLELDGVELLLQPFAAPKSSGLWADVREQLRGSLTEQGAVVEEVRGVAGRELRARTVDDDGKTSEIRFLGVDGPRWFLRGVISGISFDDAERNALAEQLFREVAVDRGAEPLPPRDLLPMHVPVAPDQDA